MRSYDYFPIIPTNQVGRRGGATLELCAHVVENIYVAVSRLFFFSFGFLFVSVVVIVTVLQRLAQNFNEVRVAPAMRAARAVRAAHAARLFFLI